MNATARDRTAASVDSAGGVMITFAVERSSRFSSFGLSISTRTLTLSASVDSTKTTRPVYGFALGRRLPDVNAAGRRADDEER